MNASEVQKELDALATPQRAAASQRYFKTGPGQYGEGDVFRGVTMPAQRRVAKKFKDLSLAETTKLLHSEYHEDRMTALLILAHRFNTAGQRDRREIYNLYLENTAYINNWDLVDTSAPRVVGGYLADKSRAPLRRLAKSKSLWERRIAVLATFHFISNNDLRDALEIAEMMLGDNEDLIHKATGWMLREAGKRNMAAEEEFLKQHYKTMPRTMLRYAIEKFPEGKRRAYLKGTM